VAKEARDPPSGVASALVPAAQGADRCRADQEEAVTDDAWVTAAQKMERLQKIAAAAEEFVRAHCALEELARRIGANAACSTALNERVIELHMKLEQLVLGDERVPGRRTS
jgi:hypothetical protein